MINSSRVATPSFIYPWMLCYDPHHCPYDGGSRDSFVSRLASGPSSVLKSSLTHSICQKTIVMSHFSNWTVTSAVGHGSGRNGRLWFGSGQSIVRKSGERRVGVRAREYLIQIDQDGSSHVGRHEGYPLGSESRNFDN